MLTLHDYWRSSASYRVRIVLNLLNLPYKAVNVNLVEGDHLSTEYKQHNPQGLVPTLTEYDNDLGQSLAIIEYLNETHDGNLLPANALGRHKARQLAYSIAMEIHPVCNLSVANHVMEIGGGDESVRAQWMEHYITKGLLSFEALLPDNCTPYCMGEHPGIADACLVPQLYNATRWGADISGLHRTNAIAAECAKLDAFINAHPDAVKQ